MNSKIKILSLAGLLMLAATSAQAHGNGHAYGHRFHRPLARKVVYVQPVVYRSCGYERPRVIQEVLLQPRERVVVQPGIRLQVSLKL